MAKNDRAQSKAKSIENRSRRKAVKAIAGGVTALAAYQVLPSSWNTPIIEQIFLPAHAATSGSVLSDPCEITLVNGTQSSSSVTIKVNGFVTPPITAVPVLIEAYGTPDSSKESAQTTTNQKGYFEATLTLTTTTGIGAVHVTTTAEGASGTAKCSISIPEASSTSEDPPSEDQSEIPDDRRNHILVSLELESLAYHGSVRVNFDPSPASTEAMTVRIYKNGTELIRQNSFQIRNPSVVLEFFAVGAPVAGDILTAEFEDINPIWLTYNIADPLVWPEPT